MSKSIGNVVDPAVIIDGGKDTHKNPSYGVDVLRLWVAHSDFSKDIQVGPGILAHVSEALRKIRNTLRFCLANIYDLDRNFLVSYDNLGELDKYLLHCLHELMTQATDSYDSFQFHKVFRLLIDFCTKDLSAFYYEIIKDRLYNDPPDGPRRRSSQTVLFHVLEVMLKIASPIASEMGEEIYRHVEPNLLADKQLSVFQTGWISKVAKWSQPDIAKRWNRIRRVRHLIFKKLEDARNEKLVGANTEIECLLYVPRSPLFTLLESLGEELNDILVFGTTSLLPLENSTKNLNTFNLKTLCSFNDESSPEVKQESGNENNFYVIMKSSSLFKCDRCRKATRKREEELCDRCTSYIRSMSSNMVKG